MATYTGVLLGATSIPVWAENASRLPVAFGASSMAAAAGALEITGHRSRALHTIGLLSATAETVLERSATRTTTARLAAAFSGPIPLATRLLAGRSRRGRQAAAVASVLGSILTRVAWIEAGRRSVRGDAARRGQPVGQ
jgi:hypothetical protein